MPVCEASKKRVSLVTGESDFSLAPTHGENCARPPRLPAPPIPCTARLGRGSKHMCHLWRGWRLHRGIQTLSRPPRHGVHAEGRGLVRDRVSRPPLPSPPHQASSAPASRPSSTAFCARRRAAAWPSSRTSWAKSASTRTWVRVCVCVRGVGGARLALSRPIGAARGDRCTRCARGAGEGGGARAPRVPSQRRAVWAARLRCWRVRVSRASPSCSLRAAAPLPAAMPAMACVLQRANGGWRVWARRVAPRAVGGCEFAPPFARPDPDAAASPLS